jgi:hypothetical protein
MTMSEPTDLIREAVDIRLRLSDIPGRDFDALNVWACDADRAIIDLIAEVRRLRDVVVAEQAETERAWNAHNEAQEKLIRKDQSCATWMDTATRLSDTVNEAQRWAAWFAAERDHIRAVRRDDLDYCERTTVALAEANTTIEAARSETAELRLSRAELADEAQQLRNWRDGDRKSVREQVRTRLAALDPILENMRDENEETAAWGDVIRRALKGEP